MRTFLEELPAANFESSPAGGEISNGREHITHCALEREEWRGELGRKMRDEV
jgi:hypothetical protein